MNVQDTMPSRIPLTLIVATTSNLGIGFKGTLPWHIKSEMQYFARVTSCAALSSPEGSRNAVIMGRKTWDSIPAKFRPLKNRVNVVISRNAPSVNVGQENWEQNPIWVDSVERAVAILEEQSSTRPAIARAFVIGGSQIYDAMKDMADSVLLTRVYGDWDVDTYFTVDYDKESKWTRASLEELNNFTGENVPEARIKEKEVEFEYRLYVKQRD